MGRHKKQTEQPKEVATSGEKIEAKVIDLGSFSEPAKDEPAADVVSESEINISADGTKQKRKYTKRDKTPENNGEPLIDGETLLMFIDILIPMVVATVNNQMTDKKISADDLVLTDKIKSKMQVFANKCAERINVSVNPFVALGVGLSGAYTMNFIAAKNK